MDAGTNGTRLTNLLTGDDTHHPRHGMLLRETRLQGPGSGYGRTDGMERARGPDIGEPVHVTPPSATASS